MKKSVLLVAAIALLACSCSQYTCPTYAKVETDQNQEINKEVTD